MDILWTCLIGILAGWLAGQIMKGSGYGVMGDLIIGLIGGLLGGLVFGLLGLSAYGTVGRLIVATIGAVLLIVILRAVKRA